MTSTADISTGGGPSTDEKRQHYGLTFAAFAVAAATFAILQSLVAPALPEIQRDLATFLAFVFLPVAHGHPWEFYVGSAILGIGIGLALSRASPSPRPNAPAVQRPRTLVADGA
jgi:hypothetical protein